MKTSWFKSLVVVGSIVLVTGFTTTNVMAQRHGGGGGGGRGISGGGGMSRGAGISRAGGSFSRPSAGAFRAGGYAYHRPGIGYRPFYRPYRRPYFGYYHFYRPYLGISINVLPYGYYPFFFGPDQFYYSGGLFYRQYDNAYKVVVPPVGAEVPSIPSGAKEVVINGQTYNEYKGVYYSTTQNADGKTVYVVAGKDGVLNTDDNSNATGTGVQIGDVVSQLPDGYREVTIKGDKYYVTDDGIYYEKITNGDQVTYKVVATDH